MATSAPESISERKAYAPSVLPSQKRSARSRSEAAWLTGDERRRGRLLPGYLADLVVLDRDPLDCLREELGEVEVVATMVGGRWVHNPPPWD